MFTLVVMGSIKEILEGWGSLMLKPYDNAEVVEPRLNACNRCEIRTGSLCDKRKGGCGCVIPAKVRSMDSKCPINKW